MITNLKNMGRITYNQLKNKSFEEIQKLYEKEDDLVKLWDLVKERFSTTEPIDDKEKELWVELQRLFEPDSNDTLWKLQRERLSIIKRSSDVDVG
ncbi:hypothetical protein Tco_1359292 [Tanacetum coccineum]